MEDVAAELYALPLDAFTRERNARAAATDDEALAGAIRSLRSPPSPPGSSTSWCGGRRRLEAGAGAGRRAARGPGRGWMPPPSPS